MTFIGGINDARCRHLNGDGTPKELVLSVFHSEQDDDGTFCREQNFHVPVPYDYPVGDRPELIGRTFKIEIQ